MHVVRFLAVFFAVACVSAADEIEIKVDETSSITGHTWAVLRCADKTATISFGPFDPEDWSFLTGCVPSTSSHKTKEPTISHTILLSPEECKSMMREINRTSGKEYCLLTQNCTTVVLNVLKAGGIDIYSRQGGLKKLVNTNLAAPKPLADELRRIQKAEREGETRTPQSTTKPNPRPANVFWRCNYKNFLHKRPEECARPDLGGEYELAK